MDRAMAMTGAPAGRSEFLELTKPRITFMVVITAAAGFWLASVGPIDLPLFLATLLGTGMVAAGASCLNQLAERETDARMDRTSGRPLPAGRVDALPAAAFGVALSLLGSLLLLLAVNRTTAVVGLVTLALYVLVYTPLKRRTTLCTVVGAVPGALPPVMGWTGASDALSAEAWVLFAILFLWQIPHFLAIAVAWRDDYARGGHVMLPVVDPDGSRTARQTVLYSAALLPVSLLPAILQMSGELYFFGALALGIGFLAFGVATARDRSVAAAKRLLRYSVAYLPILFALMAADKVAS
ncbi:MAG: heme o synthase [Alphaproteobacteria bacterium]